MGKWNSKRIAFISILIAMSISFVVIGAQTFALSSFPSLKLSLAGLPVKIVGFLFGPLIGLLVGITTDLLSFVFVPIFYHPLYSVALGITGMLPGVFSLIFNLVYKQIAPVKRMDKLIEARITCEHSLQKAFLDDQQWYIQHFEEKIKIINTKIAAIQAHPDGKHLKSNLTLAISIVLAVAIMIVITFSTSASIPQTEIDKFVDNKSLPDFFKNKAVYLILIWVTGGISILLLVISRFKMKARTFFDFAPILLFVLATEYINLAIIAWADNETIHLNFFFSFISSLLTSPIKIWMNLIIITFAIKIVLPIIEKKTFNGYV